MNDLLERAVKSALNDIVTTAPPTPETPVRAFSSSPSGRGWLVIAAALIVGAGTAGLWVVAGRGADENSPASLPPVSVEGSVTTTTAIVGNTRNGSAADSSGFVTYRHTGDGPMPVWPDVATSGKPATHLGYGLLLCDSGGAERLTALKSATGTIHDYTGTLCPRIVLEQPVPETVASCASLTPHSPDGYVYAQCQHLTDEAASSLPPAALENDSTVLTIVPDDAFAPIEPPKLFPGGLSALGSTVVAGDSISVTLADGHEWWERCFRIELPGATATGCFDPWLLGNGLAYGAFRAGDGPLQIVGIVPDDVATVEIGGTTIPVEHNVWHYTDPTATRPSFTVYSADRTRSASIGEAVSAG